MNTNEYYLIVSNYGGVYKGSEAWVYRKFIHNKNCWCMVVKNNWTLFVRRMLISNKGSPIIDKKRISSIPNSKPFSECNYVDIHKVFLIDNKPINFAWCENKNGGCISLDEPQEKEEIVYDRYIPKPKKLRKKRILTDEQKKLLKDRLLKGRLAKKASQNKELEGESAEFEEKTGKSIQSMGGDGNDL